MMRLSASSSPRLRPSSAAARGISNADKRIRIRGVAAPAAAAGDAMSSVAREWNRLVLARRRVEQERVASLTQLHEDVVATVKTMHAKEVAFTGSLKSALRPSDCAQTQQQQQQQPPESP